MRKKKVKAEEISLGQKIKSYQTILAPIVTEKSTLLLEKNNQVLFRVSSDATKKDIKTAIESLYKVKVLGVNTLNRKGKVKLWKGRRGVRSDVKQAIVRLEEGQSIDTTAEV